MERKYFIMNLTTASELEVEDALNGCIGDAETQRYSLDNTQLFFKCDSSHEHASENCTEYTLEEVKLILNNTDWQEDELF